MTPEQRKKLGDTQRKRYSNPELRKRQGRKREISWTPELGLDLSKKITLGINRRWTEKKCKVPYESSKGIYSNPPKGQTFRRLRLGKRVNQSSTIPYKNQWQLISFKKLDANPLVKHWIFLNTAIHYQDLYHDMPRHIAIDLEVYYTDNTRKLILIRPRGMQVEHHEFYSLHSIEKYCEENNYAFEIWTAEALT